MGSNKFKKSDAEGNQLPEEIGKGRNEKHIEKVLNDRLEIRINSDEKEAFNTFCKDETAAEKIRTFIKKCIS